MKRDQFKRKWIIVFQPSLFRGAKMLVFSGDWPYCHSHRIHIWYIYTYMNGWFSFTANIISFMNPMGCFLSNKKHGLRLTADFSKRLPFLGQIDWLLVVVVFLFKISSSFSNAGMWEWQMKKSWVPYFDDDMVSHVWSAERFWRNSKTEESHSSTGQCSAMIQSHATHSCMTKSICK